MFEWDNDLEMEEEAQIQNTQQETINRTWELIWYVKPNKIF